MNKKSGVFYSLLYLTVTALIVLAIWRAAMLRQGLIPSCICKAVVVRVDNSTGSGVIFVNDGNVFVWTAAHVVEAAKISACEIDPATGIAKDTFFFNDVWVYQPISENGRKVGEHRYLAKIIKYGEKDDIALLQLYKKNLTSKSAEFISDDDLPIVGEKVYHVGSMGGLTGENSFSEGTVSFIGRLRLNGQANDLNGLCYDQVCIPNIYGSSGGGVYRMDGKCIGLITEFLYAKTTFQSQGISCIVPARRIRSFAKKNSCEWAVDKNIPVSSEKLDKVITDVIIEQTVEPPKLVPNK